MPTISYMKILIYDVQYRLQAAMYTRYCQERYHGVETPNAPIVVADTHSTHYSLSWPSCICLSLFLAACSVWGVIWKGNVFWKGQIVPLMDQGRKWQCRNKMTNTKFGFASVTSVLQYVACSELPASVRMEISALSQYFKTRHLTVNKKKTKTSRFFSLGRSTRFDYLSWHCQHKCPSDIFFGVSVYCISVRYVPFQKFILFCTIEWFLNLYSLKQLLDWEWCLCQRTMLCVIEQCFVS